MAKFQIVTITFSLSFSLPPSLSPFLSLCVHVCLSVSICHFSSVFPPLPSSLVPILSYSHLVFLTVSRSAVQWVPCFAISGTLRKMWPHSSNLLHSSLVKRCSPLMSTLARHWKLLSECIQVYSTCRDFSEIICVSFATIIQCLLAVFERPVIIVIAMEVCHSLHYSFCVLRLCLTCSFYMCLFPSGT